MRQKIHDNYHWVVALVMLLQLAIYTGIGNNFNSLFVVPVTSALEISRSAFSLAISLRSLMCFLFTMVSGFLFMQFGYRRLAMVALPIAMGGYLILSVCGNAGVLALSAALLGVCDGICSTAGATRVVNDWFHRHRGTVLGVVSAFTGLGGSVICMVLTGVMEQSGWRGAYRTCALLVLAVAVVVILLVRDRPDQKGLRPFGEGELPKKKRHGAATEDLWPGYTLMELVRKPTFYLMAFCTLFSCMICYLAFFSILPHMQDCGLSLEEASTVQSFMLIVLTVAKLICGFLIDKIGARWITGICIICGAVGMWMLTGVTDMTSGFTAVLVYTLCLPITSITVPLLTTRLFGYRCHGTAVGIFLSMISVGGMVASPVINICYDTIGSYSPVYKVASVLFLAALASYLVLYTMAERDRKAWHADRQNQPANG